ncbi:MAG: thioredoxin fold domain-containing protein [Paracoccaceae bacterium]|nr:MAG: thioredoxin fold domain-containing protein [Paracoccaceae bacterium]
MTGTVRLTCAACGQGNRVALARLEGGPKCGACGAGLADGQVRPLDAATHDRVVAGDGLPVLVDYWAPWCGPCRMMAPEFARAAAALAPGVRLMKLNTEDHPEVGARAGIRGIPALILYDGGREVARLAGARPAAEIVAFARSRTAAPARG